MKNKIAKYIFILGVLLIAWSAKINDEQASKMLSSFLNDLPLDIKINGVWYTNEAE